MDIQSIPVLKVQRLILHKRNESKMKSIPFSFEAFKKIKFENLSISINLNLANSELVKNEQ